MIKKIIDGLPSLIPFLQTYPTWVQLLFSLWVLLSAVILIVLIWGKQKEPYASKKAPNEKVSHQVTIKDSPNTNIYQAGRDIVVTLPSSVEKRIEQKKIQSIMLEARLTCDLKAGAELPPDKVDFLLMSDGHAYLEGPPGKVRLAFQSPVIFRKLDANRLVVINHFVLETGSELLNRPVEVLGNYNILSIPIITIVWGKSLETIRLLEISIFINNDDPIYGSYQHNVPFKEGPRFSIPLGATSKR